MKRFAICLSACSVFLALLFCSPETPARAQQTDDGKVGQYADYGRIVQYAEVLEWQSDTQTETIIVDIRTESEVADGMVPGAKHIPLADLEQRIHELPREARIVLYCRSGNRVQRALPIFQKNGYTQVYNFVSFSRWQGPLEKPR